MIVGRNWTGCWIPSSDILLGSSPVSAYYHVREVYDITVLLNQPVPLAQSENVPGLGTSVVPSAPVSFTTRIEELVLVVA